MKATMDLTVEMFGSVMRLLERYSEINLKTMRATSEQLKGAQIYWNGVVKYITDFMDPSWVVLNAIGDVEKEKLKRVPPGQSLQDYVELLRFNLEIVQKALSGSLEAMTDFHGKESTRAFGAWLNTVLGHEGEDIAGYMERSAKLLDRVVYTYPEAIRQIKEEYGLHLQSDGYKKVAETDRFELHQVLPLDKKVKIRKAGKPIIIIPAYVLGPNILAFLPGEQKSYVHCFANQGIPTYIRVLKDIATTPAVQLMTGEDDARDTRHFCEELVVRHGKPVTLNGFCQGGFNAAVNILSGELDDLVDALITCVAPLDGSRSKALIEYMEHLPARFRDLGYSLKTLPSGNEVVDGKITSWVYKLKSIEEEGPLVALYRDLTLLARSEAQGFKINKTAAAINHWMIFDRSDLPVGITKLSYDSYTKPVAKDGTLPVKLFGRKLNFKRMAEKGIQWLICYAENDNLVDKEANLAPLDYIEAEVTPFPKGHAAIATSWSHPASECALHTTFGDNNRGPVRYQLDLEKDF
jgi:hypothetical protein